MMLLSDRTRLKMLRLLLSSALTKALFCGWLALLPALAQAQLDCIVPTREEGFEAKRPGAAELQRAARAAAVIMQKNAVFMAGNKPIRVRTTISYGGWDWQSAHVITTAYNQKAWIAGGCQVSPHADRGGGLRDGVMAIYINSPESMVGGQLGDAEFKASGMPKPLGSKAGFPIFGAEGDANNPRLLLSRSGYQPWVPVTVADVLEWHDRELKQKERDFQTSSQRNASEFNEAKIEEIYQSVRKVNAAEAEKTRTQMLAALEKSRARSAKAGPDNFLAKQRSAFDAYRASFSPAQLASPGSISHTMLRDGVMRVDDPAGKPLAKLDPRYPMRSSKGIHVIAVSLAPQPKTDPNHAWFHASLEALDVAALEKLLSD
jgi:hypothetical protein